MKQDTESLAHTKWNCKYHIVFAPKYRRQAIYGKIKADIGIMLRKLCAYKQVEILEAEPIPESALNSLMNFILHGIYIESIHEMRSKIDKKHAGLNCHKLVSYIEENICNNITIQMLCKKFYCSESYLSHLFKKHMHISIATYIYRAKMAKAKNWLSQDEKSISEIAELLQYSDVHSFSRSFKKMIGISPSEYRRLQQK